MELHKKLAIDLMNKYKLKVRNRPFIVGIDGLSGAGKTTFVNKLAAELRAQHMEPVIFHIDDHIVEREKRYHTGYEEWFEYYFLQWDVDLLTSCLFETLHHSSRLTLPFYDKTTDTIASKRVTVTNKNLVLIEGIFLLRKEWWPLFDYRIFLDCPREIRLKRVLKREKLKENQEPTMQKYKRRYWPGEDYYLRQEQPAEKADQVYDTSGVISDHV